MELSKKVGYIKGLMAGLNISDSTPEGMVLHAMSDLLEEMADEIETNAELIDDIGMYIDDLEELNGILDEDFDDIPTEVFDSDPDELLAADQLEDLSGLDELELTELPPSE